MSDLYNSYQVFKNNEFGEVRTVVLQNEVWLSPQFYVYRYTHFLMECQKSLPQSNHYP